MPRVESLLDGVPPEEAPRHLRLLGLHLRATTGRAVGHDALDSIPFFSLCHGLFLPLTGMASQRVAQLFGQELAVPAVDRPVLVREFLKRPLGLTLVEKVASLLGDPFEGKASTFRQDRLLQLLRSTWLRGGRELLDRLATTGELAALFAESLPALLADRR